MDERRSGDERRTWVTPLGSHCLDHEERTQQVAKHDAQIQELRAQTMELFGLTRGIRDDLSSIKLCVERNAGRMEAFSRRWDERAAMGDQVISEYRQAMISINTKFTDITTATSNKFQSLSMLMETSVSNLSRKMDAFKDEYEESNWFRKPLNDWYRAAPAFLAKWGTIGLIVVLLVLVSVHQLDFTRIAKAFGVIK